MRQNAARGTSDGGYLYSRQGGFPAAGINHQWKIRGPTLLNQTALITGIWHKSYGNWLGSSGFQTRAKNYLALPCDTNAEPITYTSVDDLEQDHSQLSSRSRTCCRSVVVFGWECAGSSSE
jgi:hypothetical protein